MNEITFENEQVEATGLPKVAKLEFEGLADNYARTLLIEGIFSWLFFIIVFTTIQTFTGKIGFFLSHWWFYLVASIPLLLILTLPFLIANSRGFALREKDIHYKSGIVWHKTVSLPFNRIQHVEVESGPLERFFKLTTVKLFTAGGARADMSIPALTFERSSRLRSHLVEHAGVVESGAHDE